MDMLSDSENRTRKAEKWIREVEKEGGKASSLIFSEVIFHVSRRNPQKVDWAITLIKSIRNLEIVDADESVSILAGRLRHKYYKKTERELSYLDCVHLATAITSGCNKFVTGDKDFSGIEEIEVEVY
ncbi:MAG: PIN domain-containing protein [Candidatus Aenigmarchaeota archaeon]|nr:PIN domain-containing protein [Candidatus Aenigmarchaeota archaeon]